MVNRLVSATTIGAIRAGVLLAVLGTAVTAAGQVRLLVPEQSLSGPFYARISDNVYRSDEWVAIAFYRDPGCVPPAFNLLLFYDFGNIPAIFWCSLTVRGFELWADPATDFGPKQSRLTGNGTVPVWFVPVAAFDAAVADGDLTMAELSAMPSLMRGEATLFEETLHPFGALGTMMRLVAHGNLPDGRTFHYVAIETNGVIQHVGIDFR